MSGEGNVLDKDACCQNTARETYCHIRAPITSHERQESQIFLASEMKMVALDFSVRQGKGCSGQSATWLNCPTF